MSGSRIFNLNVRKQRKSVKAKPNAFPIPILLVLPMYFSNILTKMYIRKHCATALAFILSGEKLSYMRSILCHRRCNDMYAGYTYDNIL